MSLRQREQVLRRCYEVDARFGVAASRVSRALILVSDRAIPSASKDRLV